MKSAIGRIRESYHWRWVAGSIRAAPFMAGGPWPLAASLLTGAMVAYLGAPPRSDSMNAAVVFMEYGAIATLAVLAFFVILQLILTPRRMESALRGLRPEASEMGIQWVCMRVRKPSETRCSCLCH